MNSLYVIITVMLSLGFLSTLPVTGFQQDVFAKTPKETDPCKAYKELVKIIETAGLAVVGMGDEEKMSEVLDFFSQYTNEVMELPTPDKGKC